MASTGTIFALSSGQAPSAVAVVRISGADAGAALAALAGKMPAPRRATLALLHDPADGALLDRGLLLWFPGPRSATGEDLAELHLHGGRAVVGAVLATLGRLPGLRPAKAGEFTRRAFENGRIDLAEAEGLADLLAAETEAQRRNAFAMASGELSRAIELWRAELLSASARLEAIFDFSDEDDVSDQGDGGAREAALRIAGAIEQRLARPAAERLRDGVRVVIAGPPNAGKSTLLNALAGREAAITAPTAGTTRDLIETPVAIGGTAFVLTDTAGLRVGEEEVERIGVDRARAALEAADIILWLDAAELCPDPARSIIIHARSDLHGRSDLPANADVAVSARTGSGLETLAGLLRERAERLMPGEGEVAFNRRQREALGEAAGALRLAEGAADPLLVAEALRLALAALDRIVGRAGVEDMLDALFGTFCIGK